MFYILLQSAFFDALYLYLKVSPDSLTMNNYEHIFEEVRFVLNLFILFDYFVEKLRCLISPTRSGSISSDVCT